MARHFGPQHTKNGYAAMGRNARRPVFKAVNRAETKAGSKPSKKG